MPERVVDVEDDEPMKRVAAGISRGDTILLTQHGEPLARVLPIGSPYRTGSQLAAVWPTLNHLSTEDANTFAADIETALRELPPIRSAWES